MADPATSELFSAFGSAAAGALLGSLSAFYLGILQQKKDRRERQHSALIRAQYALMSQWNILEGIRRSLLEPQRNEPDRFVKMPVFFAYGRHASVPFDEIAFIALTDEPNLLQEIHVAEQSFETCIEALRLKNQKTEEFYSASDVRIIDFDIQTGRSRVDAPHQRIFFMKQATDNLFAVVDRAIPQLLGTTQVIGAFT
jgi:hypothetical protein